MIKFSFLCLLIPKMSGEYYALLAMKEMDPQFKTLPGKTGQIKIMYLRPQCIAVFCVSPTTAVFEWNAIKTATAIEQGISLFNFTGKIETKCIKQSGMFLVHDIVSLEIIRQFSTGTVAHGWGVVIINSCGRDFMFEWNYFGVHYNV